MTGRSWADWVVLTAAVLTSLIVIWRRGIRPFFRTVNQVAQAVPILADIAQEFKPNHGSSLRDVIDGIRAELAVNNAAQLEVARRLDERDKLLDDRAASITLQLNNIEQATANTVTDDGIV